MNSDGRVNPVVLLGEWNRGVEAFLGRSAAADGQHGADSGCTRAIEHGGAVFVELGEFEMRVGVYDFHDVRKRAEKLKAREILHPA